MVRLVNLLATFQVQKKKKTSQRVSLEKSVPCYLHLAINNHLIMLLVALFKMVGDFRFNRSQESSFTLMVHRDQFNSTHHFPGFTMNQKQS